MLSYLYLKYHELMNFLQYLKGTSHRHSFIIYIHVVNSLIREAHLPYPNARRTNLAECNYFQTILRLFDNFLSRKYPRAQNDSGHSNVTSALVFQ